MQKTLNQSTTGCGEVSQGAAFGSLRQQVDPYVYLQQLTRNLKNPKLKDSSKTINTTQTAQFFNEKQKELSVSNSESFGQFDKIQSLRSSEKHGTALKKEIFKDVIEEDQGEVHGTPLMKHSYARGQPNLIQPDFNATCPDFDGLDWMNDYNS